mmetsp:Transcript_13351/g.16971  ORF Transcript_13351/g.16971 Transcript_13351/m.16971 type:complete len:171 (+) Transcript_13351:163-675(+)
MKAFFGKQDKEFEHNSKEASSYMLYSLASNYAQNEKWDHAIRLYNNALVLQRDTLGKNHPVVARTLNDIGVALTAIGESYGAMTALEEALWIRQQTLGNGHEDVAETTNNLWVLLHNTHVGLGEEETRKIVKPTLQRKHVGLEEEETRKIAKPTLQCKRVGKTGVVARSA